MDFISQVLESINPFAVKHVERYQEREQAL
jgi:hypothetical protein